MSIQVFDFDFDRDLPLYGTNTLEEAYDLAEGIDKGEIQDFRSQKIKTWSITDGAVKKVK